jgi:hypothetical protein
MNEAGYPRFTKYMATGYSMGQLSCGTPVVNFQTDIAAARRVENEHRLPQDWNEGVVGTRLHLKGARQWERCEAPCTEGLLRNRCRNEIVAPSTQVLTPRVHSSAEHHLVAYPICQS